jgi:hypothetical protein
LIPSRVGEGNLITERLQSLGFFVLGGNLLLDSLNSLGCRSRRHRCSIGLGFGLRSLRLGVERTD